MGNHVNPSPALKGRAIDPFVILKPNNAHVKFLIWGGSGTGKTLWSLSADNVAYISLESGADRYSSLKISAFCPKNLTELGQALKFLKNSNNQYQTVVIDSISVAWSMFMEELIPEGLKADWVMVKTRWKRFLRTLLSLQKDVILIGRSKEARSDSAWYKKTGDLVLDSEASIGINTNLRASDLCRITVGMVRELKMGDELVLVEKKTGKERRINLNDECVKAIQKLIQSSNEPRSDDSQLFRGRQGVIKTTGVNYLVKKWCLMINLKGRYGSHSLRKTFGYQMRVQHKVSIPILMTMFNHSSQKQTLDYLCVQPDELKEVYMLGVG